MSRPFLTALACTIPMVLSAQSTRLLHQPDVSARYVAFAYAGDIWLAPRAGGDARRITSSPGVEQDPHFSPDGKWLAFTAEYGGNPDVYVVGIDSGAPRRLTWHPGPDQVRGWTPDGKSVVFMSPRAGVPDGEPQLWSVALTGGLPERLPLLRAQSGAISPDGQSVAYQLVRPWEVEMRNYRGGQNQPIRIYNLKTGTVEALPWTDSRDQQPVWLGSSVYFISDRDWTNNVWAWDAATHAVRQITHYADYEVESVNAGAGVIAYEQAGDIHLYDPATSKDTKLEIHVAGDFPWTMPHAVDVARSLTAPQLSPKGVRAVFEARGDIFTVPTDKGTWRNLTQSSGVADRSPIWSPDGKRIAWFSDSTGEYRLMVSDQDGLTPARAYPLAHPSFFYAPAWSPDGSRILFTDAQLELRVLDLATGKEVHVDADNYTWPDRNLNPRWSPDSRWIAYTKRLKGSQFHAVFVYNVADGTTHQLTDGLSDVVNPAWDKGGKYLLFLASTNWALNTGWLDMSSYDRPVDRSVYLAVLSRSDPSPLLPEPGDEIADSVRRPPADTTTPKPDTTTHARARRDSVAVHIDFDGFSQRILSLGVPSRNYANLSAGSAGQWFYLERVPNHADILHRFDLKTRKAIDFVPAAGEEYALSFDGKKLLYQGAAPSGAPSGTWAVVDAGDAPPAAGHGALVTQGLRIDLDPLAEWRQIFNEAWRIERDYLYVANMNGADWPAIKQRYAALLPDVRHRADLSTLLGQMQGELTVGHSFVGGGDLPHIDAGQAGLLGADFTVTQGRYRITRIYTGENWNPELHAPLSAPGVDVRTGDYIIAVNGRDVTGTENLYASFIGTAGRQVELRVNDRPTADGSRLVTVVPVSSDADLRTRDWIESNRRLVDSLSGGKLAYVYVPNTGGGGYASFNRYYFAQQNKQGAVIDERFNHGGSIADYMVDIMNRQLHGYFNQRIGDRYEAVTAPAAAIWGPKVLIINEMSGSGGDMFPYMFRQLGIGPLIGTRTWGGLVGWGGEPPLIDGGFISAPSTGFYNPAGQWDVENQGVAPDITVAEDPAQLRTGHDVQLERAVTEALRLLREHPVALMGEPAAPDRVHPKKPGGR
ncbi:MAG: S41 family peptidase [Gemmatimonadales bacterium]